MARPGRRRLPAQSDPLPVTLLSSADIAELKALVGPQGWVEDPGQLRGNLTEWRGLFTGSTPLMLMPATTGEASAVMALCHRRRIGVVPQGGNTGLVGGAIPHATEARVEIILSSRRLSRIRSVDADNFTMTAESGCVLADVQAAAVAAGRLFPLSLGAEGSCHLGGNLSTNAGGTAVLRYGNARDLVLGLEVVLPDGRIFDGLRALRKDNTGYDLKHLFIGAEGTLGFITAATCKLFPAPRTTATAWVAVADPRAALELFSAARDQLGDELTACEFANRLAVDLVVRHVPGCRAPLAGTHAWYVLLEVATSRQGADSDGDLERFLATQMEGGRVADAIVAASGRHRAEFWRLRHSMSEAQRHEGASIKHDISVPVNRMADFLHQAGDRAGELLPGVRIVAFGHLGDGNVHFNLTQPPGADRQEYLGHWAAVAQVVHQVAVDLGGSFSAEHGIGALKTGDLRRWRGGVGLDLMRTVKAALDPHNIMNPGKLFGD